MGGREEAGGRAGWVESVFPYFPPCFLLLPGFPHAPEGGALVRPPRQIIAVRPIHGGAMHVRDFFPAHIIFHATITLMLLLLWVHFFCQGQHYVYSTRIW